MSAAPAGLEPVACATVHDAIMAVQRRETDRALVPIENALEGSVDPTLDALAGEAGDVRIVGELIHPVRHCIIAARELAFGDVEAVVSHPQATAQCREFLRRELPGARILAANSTADAVVQVVGEPARPWAAIAPRLAAELHGGTILRAGVEDVAGNETRFVWLAPADAGGEVASDGEQPWRTSILFWGAGAEAPGWLVRCLSEFAFRGVNLTKIESRPRRERLGRYMFFVDCDGRSGDEQVAGAIDGLRAHCEEVRVMGSYPAAFAA